jgi:SAM-dependent methyltransferase
MSDPSPVELLFSGMDKLGPGGDPHTLRVLRSLPRRSFDVVVDAGCGTGRQTFALARELGTPVDAVDSYQPFLTELAERAKRLGIDRLVRTHRMDMADIPRVFPRIDLLWSEGAAYHIGFRNALRTWASSLAADGFAVVSEPAWLTDRVPDAVREFFAAAYPDMRSVPENVAAAEAERYTVISTYRLPSQTWVDGYYEVLEPRAEALADHPDPSVREFAATMRREIEVFGLSEGSYGYVFYLLRR